MSDKKEIIRVKALDDVSFRTLFWAIIQEVTPIYFTPDISPKHQVHSTHDQTLIFGDQICIFDHKQVDKGYSYSFSWSTHTFLAGLDFWRDRLDMCVFTHLTFGRINQLLA